MNNLIQYYSVGKCLGVILVFLYHNAYTVKLLRKVNLSVVVLEPGTAKVTWLHLGKSFVVSLNGERHPPWRERVS